MSLFSSKIAAVIPLSLLVPAVAFAQEAEPAPAEEAPAEPEEALEEEEPADEAPAPEEPAEEPEPEETVEPEPEPAELDVQPEPAPAETPLAAPVDEPPVEDEPAAPSMSPVDVGTHTFTRFEYRQNYDKIGVSRTRFQEGDATFFRTRLTLKTNPLPLGKNLTGHLYFAPQATGQWGTQGGGGTIGEASLGIYEGYFQLSSDLMDFKLGRFAMKYGDVLVIGDLDWHQSGRAFDGAHLSLKPGKVKIDAFVTQTSEGYPANQPFMVGDNLFWGAYAQFGGAIAEGMGLDLYALVKTAGATDTQVDDDGDPDTPDVTQHVDAASFVTFGARAKQNLGVFDYRAEAGIQVGKTPSASDANNKFAYQGDAEIGISPIKGMRFGVNGAIASGDGDPTDDVDRTWDELYPTTHKFMGLMDVIGFRRNVATVNLKFSANLAKATVFKLDAHYFTRLENYLALGKTGDEYMAGYEFDTQLVQKIGQFAYARGLYGIFLPNKEHYGTSIAVHYLEIQGGLKF